MHLSSNWVDSTSCFKRIDLHCHSRASTEADEAVLQAIRCPESYSEPQQIYAQAKQRGMDFVTITDHDSIAGAIELHHHADTFVGEELTCYFPDDHCKMHVLVWGISAADHDALQSRAQDIYQVAEYIASHRLAHAVAHPLYRQNGKLRAWHLERLLLLFRGFETLNGAHSMLHREAFEPLLDDLDERGVRRLERRHRIDALWPMPWQKTRTGGSDDHGLFNIGRTWTEFPSGLNSVDDALECLRQGRCRPGGEAGSSVKLAHNFYGVGTRYYLRQFASPRIAAKCAMMQRMVGEAPTASRTAMVVEAVKFLGSRFLDRSARLIGLRRQPRGTQLLADLLIDSALRLFSNATGLVNALNEGRAPLAEHEEMFDLVCRVSREVIQGIGQSVARSAHDGQIGEIFDALAAVIAHQAMLLPYYFALFHQNQERHLLSELTGRTRRRDARSLRVAVFTDSLDQTDDATAFAKEIIIRSQAAGLELTVYTCMSFSHHSATPRSRNFQPLISCGAQLHLPPLLEILEAADREQFDLIIANGVGVMSACAWPTSRMLRVPMLTIQHDDAAARIHSFCGGDYRLTTAMEAFSRWLREASTEVFMPSSAEEAFESLLTRCVRATGLGTRYANAGRANNESHQDVAEAEVATP